MAKAVFHKGQRVYVKPVGTWAVVESTYSPNGTELHPFNGLLGAAQAARDLEHERS